MTKSTKVFTHQKGYLTPTRLFYVYTGSYKAYVTFSWFHRLQQEKTSTTAGVPDKAALTTASPYKESASASKGSVRKTSNDPETVRRKAIVTQSS
jgi:hypothetical protein